MATLNVKLPDEQKEDLAKLAELKRYPSVSEYVREALRNQMERDLEVSEEVKRRLELLREGDTETLTAEEMKEKISDE